MSTVMRQLYRVLGIAMSLALGLAAFAAHAQALAVDEPATVCESTVRVDDTLRFRPDTIEIPSSCRDFTVTLQHVGRLPAVASPRNWVLVKAGDADAVARTGAAAGQAQGYVDVNDDRVLVASAVIGRDQSVQVQIPVSQLEPDQAYTYLSTIPGFSPAMRGTLRVVNGTH